MGIEDYRITEAKIDENGVVHQPDILTGTAKENKSAFDELTRIIVAPAVNAIIDLGVMTEGKVEEWSKNEADRKAAERIRVSNEANRELAEDLRKTAESKRLNAEADRAEAEITRKDNEDTRISDEADRQENERLRGIAEAMRDTKDSIRDTNERARSKAESDRVTAESDRVTAESARATAELERSAAERAREEAETIRNNNENRREFQESARFSQEHGRIAAENARLVSEYTRVDNENARIGAELTRNTQEETRVSNEQIRVEAEAERQNAEVKRQTDEEKRQNAALKVLEADKLLSLKADQPYNISTGESIEIEDSAGGTMREISIKGNSTQKEVPSPDTPVAILHTDNPVALRTYGENRFCADFSIDCTKIDGSSCKILHTGTKTFAIAAIDVAQNVGQAYTLRIDFSKALPSPCTLLVQGMNAAGNRISFSTMEIGGQTTVIKNWAGVAGCTKIVGVSLWTNSAETFDLTAQYTLREGSTAEAYIPYCGNDYFIPVRDDAKETQFLGKIGSCADELQLDALGKGRLKKNCAQIALADATEASLLNKTDLFRTGGYNYAYVYLENPARLPQNALCTHLPVTLSTDGTKECIVLNAAGTILSVWLADTRTGCTAEDSKAERIAKINAALKSIAGNTGMSVSFAYAQQNSNVIDLSEDTKNELQSIRIDAGSAAIHAQCTQIQPSEISVQYRQSLESYIIQIIKSLS